MKSKLMTEAIRLTTDIDTHRIKHEINKTKKRELQKESNGYKSKENKKME
jgi:hypothetical protein